MTTILLQLHPAAAKYFKYHHDYLPNRPSTLRDHFRHLVMLVAKPHPTGVLKTKEGKVDVNALISVQSPYVGIDARSSALYIPDEQLKLLDDLLIHLIDQEINNAVELYIDSGKQVKSAIQYIMDKYDIEESDRYSFDRAIKMNQRYRNRQIAQ